MKELKFHSKKGRLVNISPDQTEAYRVDASLEFTDGVVFSATPLEFGRPFVVKIKETVTAWNGSIEIGLISTDPSMVEVPRSIALRGTDVWWVSGSSVFHDQSALRNDYCCDLDRLKIGDSVGIMLTEANEMHLLLNGVDQGCATICSADTVWAVIDIYGMCSGVEIVQPTTMASDGIPVAAEEICNSSFDPTSRGICVDENKLKFHDKCGSLIRFYDNNLTAERTNPEDEFNNGVVMTNRCLRNNELFEIRINDLVHKWSGSIEIGVTTHDPDVLDIPTTMTNLRSGTIMFSGCGILTNGKCTRKQYSNFHLDQLKLQDHIGVMRKRNGSLHFFINGIDQGVAATNLPTTVYAVVDLYGMTVNVSIVEQHSMIDSDIRNACISSYIDNEVGIFVNHGELLFDEVHHGKNVTVVDGNCGKRINPIEDFNHAILMTSRCLKLGEKMTLSIKDVVGKWAGSLEVGVSTLDPSTTEFPATATNFKTGDTWMFTASGIMHNGNKILEEYGTNMSYNVGDKISVLRRHNGDLHFFNNGVDFGLAVTGIPEQVYGVVDLYGQNSSVFLAQHNQAEFDLPKSSDFRDLYLTSNANTVQDLSLGVHTRNIEFDQSTATFYRKNCAFTYTEAISVINRCIKSPTDCVEFAIGTIIPHWSGCIEIGAKLQTDESLFDKSSLIYERNMLFVWSGNLLVNHKKKQKILCSTCNFKTGNTVKVQKIDHTKVEISVDGVELFTCKVPDEPFNVVLNLYGKCAEVTLLPEVEKRRKIVPETQAELCSVNLRRESGFILSKSKITPHANQITVEITEVADEHSLDFDGFKAGYVEIKCKENLIFTADDSFTEFLLSRPHYIISSTSETVNGKVLKRPVCTGMNRISLKDRFVLSLENNIFTVLLNGIKIFERTAMLPTPGENEAELFFIFGFSEGVKSITHCLTSSNPLETKGSSAQCVFSNVSIGPNVKIASNSLSATRHASYHGGFLATTKPIFQNESFKIEITHLSSKWSESLVIGITTDPKQTNYKSSNSIYFFGSSIFYGNCKIKSNCIDDLNTLKVGQQVGVIVKNSCLHLIIDNADYGPAINLSNNIFYPFIDLYGNCDAVEIVHDDAVKEPSEKEVKIKAEENKNWCTNGQLCKEILQHLKLPKVFVNETLVQCFCEKCFSNDTIIKAQGDPSLNFTLPKNWCRVELNSHPNIDTETILKNWNTAYYGTSMMSLRKVLDLGEVPIVSDTWNLISIATVQTKGISMVSPSVDKAVEKLSKEMYCSAKTGAKYSLHSAFQVLLKPGTFKINSPVAVGDVKSRMDAHEWFVSKHGTSVLSHLLFNFNKIEENSI